MSDRFTSAKLKGVFGSGLAEYGRLSKEDMIKKVRDYASYQVSLYSKILKANDKDFHITTYIGSYVEKKKEVLQEGKDFKEDA